MRSVSGLDRAQDRRGMFKSGGSGGITGNEGAEGR
jgi:hypothetical protein